MQKNKILSMVLRIVSIFVGLLFIFSGLIKANDPSGLAYKMGEFYEVWAREGYFPKFMQWLNEYALASSVAMITFEIVAGVALIIGYRFKLFSYLIFLLTVFFTFLTGYALFSGNIKECGCFGDCIKLQANESFMKDIILLVLIFILLMLRKHVTQAFKNSIATTLMILTVVLSLFMQWYVLKHLPFKDCLAYKVGSNIQKEMEYGENYKAAVVETKMVYKNIQSGEKKEFTMQNYPWQDTLHWKYDTTLSKEISPEKNAPQIKDFSISNYNGEDITQALLSNPNSIFVVFIKSTHEANTSNIEALRALIADCKKQNITIIAVSASTDIETNEFKLKHKLDIEFNTLDGTVCKTAMRSNPGIMLWKQGVILGKWSYADYPTLSKLRITN